MGSPSRSAPTLSRRRFLRIAGITGLGALASAIVRIPPVGGFGRLAAARAGRRLAYWSDPKTWGGKVPAPNDLVIISKKVVLDVDARVRGLVIKPKGKLVFHPRRSVTLLSTGNVVVRGGLTMRAPRPSVVHSLSFLRIDERRFVGGGMRVLSSDVGLWAMGDGEVDLAGAPKLAWTRTTEAVPAGATTFTLRDEPWGWRVGDEVILTPTLPPSDSTHHIAYDTGTVAAVDMLSRRITLSYPTKFVHPAVQVEPGMVYTAEVLNLTRNVRIEGTPTGRSHILVHSSRPQFFRNASLRYMGPRQPISNVSMFTKPVTGRYGLHFHTMDGASKGSIVKGVVVRESGNHAFVTHQSHGVTFSDCVTHDTFEDAYWWDPSPSMDPAKAPPTDNVLYERCVASLIRSDPPVDGFFRLAGFFLGARNGNAIRDCVAVGVQGGGDSCGFHWPFLSVGVWKFEDCLAHNNGSNGITVWQSNGLPHVASRFTAYHNGRFGIHNGQYANGFLFEDSVLYGNKLGALLSNAASFASASQRFTGVVFDQAGLSDYCVLGADLVLVPRRPVQFVGCRFRGYGKAALGFVDTPPFPNDLTLLNCTFEGNEFWLAPDIHPATRIRVQDPVHGMITVRRADQAGTFRPEWNASVS